METRVEELVEQARRLPLPQQLTLIERLARSIQSDLHSVRALQGEFAAWDALSDEAMANFEKGP